MMPIRTAEKAQHGRRIGEPDHDDCNSGEPADHMQDGEGTEST